MDQFKTLFIHFSHRHSCDQKSINWRNAIIGFTYAKEKKARNLA